VALLASVGVVMLVTEHLLPEVSGAGLVYFFIISYTGLQSLAQAHRKRKERKQLALEKDRQLQLTLPSVDPDGDETPTEAVNAPAEPEPYPTSYCPHVAIMVPCHNEATVIEKTILGLLALDYPSFELWVIDDRSTDTTPAVLAQLQTQLQTQHPDRLHWFSRPSTATPGKSAVLNDARKRVGPLTQVVAVFDADAAIAPNFLHALMPLLADDRVGAVQARKVMSNAHENLLTLCQQYEYCLDAHFQSGRDAVHGAVELRGNGQLIKTRALDAVGGWNEATLTDDLDLSTQLHLAGWDVRFAHKVLVQEEAVRKFLPLLRQRRRWAEGSLVRYLTYASRLLTAPHVSLRATIDMVAWFTQFLMPFWLLLDYGLLGISLLFGGANRIHLISALLLLPLLSLFFTSSLIIGIKRFERLSWFNAFRWACTTGMYMTVVWFPIVFWVTLRLLLRPANGALDWGKTEHGGPSVHKPSNNLSNNLANNSGPLLTEGHVNGNIEGINNIEGIKG
jgi:1,2-diacylglycerol 3-beta-glucosyltransferase